MDAEEVEESLQLELIEIQCDDSLKSQHQLLSLPDFYQSLENAKFPLMTPCKKNGPVRLNIHLWTNIFSVKSEQKQTENKNDW